MRRSLPVTALLAGTLVLAACNSSTGTQKTVTFTNTVTGSAAVSVASAASSAVPVTGGSVSVAGPSASASIGSGSAAARSSAVPSSAPAPSVVPSSAVPSSVAPSSAAVVKVDPLKVDCTTLLTAEDVKNALGATIPTSSLRVRDVADPSRGVTGKVRCRYGSTDNGKTAKVGVILTQYTDAAAAKKQFGTSVQSEVDQGATRSDISIKGTPATLLLRSGALVVLQYDTWTMSISAADKLAATDKLTSGMPVLAQEALARITKKS